MLIYLYFVLFNSKEWNIDDNLYVYNINILIYIFFLKKKCLNLVN